MTRIARILEADLEAVKAAYPSLICPHCGTLYLGRPASFGSDYPCDCCGYRFGVDQETGIPRPLEKAEFSEYRKPECELVVMGD